MLVQNLLRNEFEVEAGEKERKWGRRGGKAEGEEQERSTNPRSSQSTLPYNNRSNGSICGMDIRVNNINAVLVHECCIGAFPSCDATTAVAECDGGLFDPRCTESIEEICFSCYFSILEVGVA